MVSRVGLPSHSETEFHDFEQANIDADTSSNIDELKEFCCSIISEPFLEAANYTSIDAPLGVEEWALSGLTKRPSE
jgi:hypothetical protein